MAVISDKNKKEMKNAAPPDPTLDDLLRFVGPIAVDFSHNCFFWSVLRFGVSLQYHARFMCSLATARSAAMSYAASGGIFGLVETFLTKFRGKSDFINSGVAGCCAGLIHSPGFYEWKLPRLLNCMLLGGVGMLSYYVHTRPSKFYIGREMTVPEFLGFTPIPVSTHPLPNSSLSSCLMILAKNMFLTSTLGIMMGLALFPERSEVGPILSFNNACSFTKFSSIAVGAVGYSFLLFRELHGIEDDIMNEAVFGCVTSLFIPQTYDSGKAFLLRCIGTGAVYISSGKLLTDHSPFFPHLSLLHEKQKKAGILPPFTLALPKSMEDGFSAFHKSLKNGMKKKSNF